MDDYAYCAAQVRDYDSDRYVTALFAPADRRADVLVLYAFNLELARSRESVSEPMLGRIRLQWWRDVIGECYEGKVRRHQVAQPLAAVIERNRLSRQLFDRIIDARELDHETEPPERIGELLEYARATCGGLNRLALEILEVRDPETADAAEAVGTAWALTGIVRGLRHLLAVGRRPLPREVMERHGVSQSDLLGLHPSERLGSAVREIADIASKTLETANAGRNRKALPIFLPAVLARTYLKRLAMTGYNPFDERNQRPLSYRTWRLMAATLTRRV